MMNTIRTNVAANAVNASTNTILAVDLGKFKSVGCVHDTATGEFLFTTFDTTRDELRSLIVKFQPAVVRFGNRRVSSQRGLSDRTGDRLLRMSVTNGRRGVLR